MTVSLVTGVSRRVGIGFAIAKRLAEAGSDLFLQHYTPYDDEQPWGADGDGPAALAPELLMIGKRVEQASADFQEPASPNDLMKTAVSRYGLIDNLILNHAYSTMSGLGSLTAQQIDAHMQVNVRASLLLIQAFVQQRNGRSGGRIILLTSGQHLGPMPDELAYIASKGALHQLTLSLSAALAPKKITVNTVNPGATDTGYATGDLYEMVRNASPMGRWGEPDDAARLIAWLCSDDARWITGQVINSNGGGL